MRETVKSLRKRYRDMLTIRLFEEAVEKLFAEGRIQGTAHPSIGQEAIAVGVAAALRKGDRVTSTHRGHGHMIAMGGRVDRMMAELFGKRTGYSSGRGGSQLMADYRLGFIGGNGITGGSIAVATGLAMAQKHHGTGNVVVCFFGDGAANQGAFHESLNMAAIWKLPVVYVCENNAYAMSTPVAQAVSVPHIADRAVAYGMPGLVVDGNDYFAVREAMAAARERAAVGGGPTLLEGKTYRMCGHSRGDPCNYRSREEFELWKPRDPIPRFRRCLLKEGSLESGEARAMRADVAREIREAVAFARRSPEGDAGDLEKGVFA